MQSSLGENGGAKLDAGERVTWYHWVVVIIASAGWLFDCMDQRIFVLSRAPAVKELIHWDERRGPLAADDTELVLVRLGTPLRVDRRLLPQGFE